MANIFCNDDGSNTAPYETWAKAATTLLVAVDALAAGDDLIIGADHAETPGANTVLTFSATEASINRVISSTVGAASVIVYNKADNVQLDLSTGSFDLTIAGFVIFYGFSVAIGDDFLVVTTFSSVKLEDCVIEMTGSASDFFIASSSSQIIFILKNTDINWSTGGTANNFTFGGIIFRWFGGTVSWTGTQPTKFIDGTDRTNSVVFSGVDLSAITSSLIDASDSADNVITFYHCLLNSGVSLTTGTIKSRGSEYLISGCDDTTGNDLYRLEYVDFWGSTVHDDAVYRDSGASDGTTNISWKMVSTANAVEFSEPTLSPPLHAWVATAASTTFTVSIVWDSASDLQDDEVWLEIEYLEASADTDSAFADDRSADITTTPVDQTNNTETWTGTGGFGTVNKIEVAVTATVNRVGPVIARVCLAKPSTTIYVDPLIVQS